MSANKKIKRVLVGIPQGHKHIRTVIEFESGEPLVFREFEMASISRAFIHILTHPLDKAIELLCEHTKGKEGFAPIQLIETNRSSKQIQKELSNIMSEYQ